MEGSSWYRTDHVTTSGEKTRRLPDPTRPTKLIAFGGSFLNTATRTSHRRLLYQTGGE